ncbi:hypothetical protein ACQP0C_31970 [Nocardia sp. CA-129566]|uniref:hypothetical protein n=1 Tax=Nocardia sp. CA-129566 TaxID=3239976 RepID=UPI003D95F3F1
MRCVAVDADKRPIDVNQAVGTTTHLSCAGDRNPLELLVVERNSNRVASAIQPYTNAAVAGDEQWERASGRGRLIWQDFIGSSGDPAGALQSNSPTAAEAIAG